MKHTIWHKVEHFGVVGSSPAIPAAIRRASTPLNARFSTLSWIICLGRVSIVGRRGLAAHRLIKCMRARQIEISLRCICINMYLPHSIEHLVNPIIWQRTLTLSTLVMNMIDSPSQAMCFSLTEQDFLTSVILNAANSTQKQKHFRSSHTTSQHYIVSTPSPHRQLPHNTSAQQAIRPVTTSASRTAHSHRLAKKLRQGFPAEDLACDGACR